MKCFGKLFERGGAAMIAFFALFCFGARDGGMLKFQQSGGPWCDHVG